MWEVSISHYFEHITTLQSRIIFLGPAFDGSLLHEGAVELDSNS